MNWGIVWSVVVAIGILMGVMATICISMFGVMSSRMKKTMRAGGIPTCPMPGCSFHKKIETAMKSTSTAN